MSPLSRTARALPVLLTLALVGGCASNQPGALVTGSPAPTAAATASAEATPAPTPTTAVSDEDVPAPQPTQTAVDGRTVVLPSVTAAVWNSATAAVEVSAFVPVVESTGRCTLVLTSGTSTATTESVAYADASSTSCDLLSIPGTGLASGTWRVTVTYSSPDSAGSSDATEVVVP